MSGDLNSGVVVVVMVVVVMMMVVLPVSERRTANVINSRVAASILFMARILAWFQLPAEVRPQSTYPINNYANCVEHERAFAPEW